MTSTTTGRRTKFNLHRDDPRRPAAEPAYDRELIARMLTEYNAGLIGQFSPVAVEHQIKLLREAENHSADSPNSTDKE